MGTGRKFVNLLTIVITSNFMMPPSTQARMKFLAAAAYFYSSTAPATAAHLMRECHHVATGNEIALKQSESNRACQACGTIAIPGWTLRTSILHSPRSKKPRAKLRKQGPDARRQSQKIVISKCLACHRSVKTPLMPKNPVGVSRGKGSGGARVPLPESQPMENKSDRGISSEQETQQQPPSANLSSKKRAKARKQGGLQAMLEKSKAMPTQSSSFSLDLMDLMKSTWLARFYYAQFCILYSWFLWILTFILGFKNLPYNHKATEIFLPMDFSTDALINKTCQNLGTRSLFDQSPRLSLHRCVIRTRCIVLGAGSPGPTASSESWPAPSRFPSAASWGPDEYCAPEFSG